MILEKGAFEGLNTKFQRMFTLEKSEVPSLPGRREGATLENIEVKLLEVKNYDGAGPVQGS